MVSFYYFSKYEKSEICVLWGNLGLILNTCYKFYYELRSRYSLYVVRAQELKDHPYFEGTDWQQVYLQKYTPPLIPPRGEVNAADAFDIGSFDEEDTKGIKVRRDLFSYVYKTSYYC